MRAAGRRPKHSRTMVESVNDDVKAKHSTDPNDLKGCDNDCTKAAPGAVGYHFSLLFQWLAERLSADRLPLRCTRQHAECLSNSRPTRALHGARSI